MRSNQFSRAGKRLQGLNDIYNSNGNIDSYEASDSGVTVDDSANADTGADASSFIETLVDAAGQLVTVDQQRQLNNLNIQRANKNLPPIRLRAAGAPAPKNNLLLYAAFGLGAYLLIRR